MIVLWLISAALGQDVAATFAALAAHDTLRASFTQVQHRKVFSRPLQSSGTIVFSRPDNVRWSVAEPSPSVFVLNGSRITMSYPALKVTETLSLSDRPEMMGLIGALMVWLEADIAKIRASYELELQGDVAVLVPRDEALRRWVSKMALTLADDRSHVRAIEITEPDGDRVDIRFQGVELGVPVAPSTFSAP